MITLINIYASPESNKHFFKSLFTHIASESGGIVLCAGDFNVILDHKSDTTSIRRQNMHLTKLKNYDE